MKNYYLPGIFNQRPQAFITWNKRLQAGFIAVFKQANPS
jgi:hypothetical protein